jgi:hypothetical protein
MAIPDFTINDLQSFQKATAAPRQVAGLYFDYMLDYLDDLAHKLSYDWRKEPQKYRDLGRPSVAPLLAKLRAQYGSETNVPSTEQRNEIYVPLFGEWDASPSSSASSFPRLRNELFDAVTRFAEHPADITVDMLRASVRNILVDFQDYLAGLQGDSVAFSKEVLDDFTENTCYPILRNEKIAAAFGISKSASNNYPYGPDPGMDLLVEEISKQLASMDSSRGNVTRRESSNRQTAARAGAAAIASAIEAGANPPDADVDVVTLRSYQWASASRWLADQVKSDVRPQPSITSEMVAPIARPASLSLYKRQ